MSAIPTPQTAAPTPHALRPTPSREADNHADKLKSEADFFNRHYTAEAAAGITPLSNADRHRYTAPPADTVYPREFVFHCLAPLHHKTLLEIASGNGIDANLAAHNGATVYTYDVSPASNDLVNRRATVNQLTDRIHTTVAAHPDEAANHFNLQQVDHILGYAALHHLPDWQGLGPTLYHRLKPGGSAVFAEPTSNSPFLRWLRNRVPLAIDEMTDDETPLTDRDLLAFAAPFDRVTVRHFQLTARLWRLWPHRPKLAATLHHLDAKLLRLCPPMKRFCTVTVLACHRDS
ncbi:MAG: methyltransferase domain-containing protein [Planctomycetota bacterium]